MVRLGQEFVNTYEHIAVPTKSGGGGREGGTGAGCRAVWGGTGWWETREVVPGWVACRDDQVGAGLVGAAGVSSPTGSGRGRVLPGGARGRPRRGRRRTRGCRRS